MVGGAGSVSHSLHGSRRTSHDKLQAQGLSRNSSGANHQPHQHPHTGGKGDSLGGEASMHALAEKLLQHELK
jgi:hypothetical protein